MYWTAVDVLASLLLDLEVICKSRNGESGNGMRGMRGMGEYNWNRKNKMKVYKIQFSFFLAEIKKKKLELS